MISHDDRFVECSVVLSRTESPSNIKKVDGKMIFAERTMKGLDYKVEFLMRTDEGDRVVASTEPVAGVVPIGIDFTWRFCEEPGITSVNVSVNSEMKPKVRNGMVVVSPVVKKFGLAELEEAFLAGRKRTYGAFEEEQFDYETFRDWFTTLNKNI